MARDKVHKVMSEFKEGTLHSGSPSGPKVTSRKQAVAIGLSEARKAGESVSPARGGGNNPARTRKARKRKARRKGPPTTTAFQGNESYRDY